jgi:hypothetical protein
VLDSVISIQTWNTVFRRTTTVYRDYSAWYHIVVAFDTTQATAANRLKLYVNGLEQTAFSLSTDPTQNTDYPINNNIAHSIFNDGFGSYLSGYLTEVNFVDGQALTPTSFGEADPDTGVWRPKRYIGTYGTNGFYLNFSDNSNTTATTLGKDYSGNGNNWTPNNFSVAAGAENDSLVDSPTSYGTDTGVGGEVRGNYCTLNPLQTTAGTITFSNGNLEFTKVAGAGTNVFWFGNMSFPSSGKWYWEFTPTTATDHHIGIQAAETMTYVEGTRLILRNDGAAIRNSSLVASITSFTANDVIGIAVNVDALTVQYYKNGSVNGSAISVNDLNTLPYRAYYLSGNAGSAGNVNFGQRPFAYTAPSGFKALCSQNLPTPAIGATSTTQASKYFNSVLFTGNGGTLSINNVGFQPDFIWVKSRNTIENGGNIVVDAVRGRGMLSTNNTVAEIVNGASYEFVSYDTNGFTLGAGYSLNINPNGVPVVTWNWNAGGTTVTNTAGSITSQVRANTTAGFSIVSYSAGATNATVGHGLGVAPAMIIVKCRTNASAPWVIYHKSLSNQKDYTLVFGTDAQINIGNYWGTSGPNSTTFGTSLNGYANNIENLIAYCWAEIDGYSRFGSYRGNGSSDGPFVYCGFRPQYVLIKNITGSSGNWVIYDTARNTFNLSGYKLAANLNDAENSGANLGDTTIGIDIRSNGFKIRTTGNNHNNSAENYIFAAFAETPFKYARAR